MLRIKLIRHGQTEGNKHSRYIGVTDEPLCQDGQNELKKMNYQKPQLLFVSPMLRCRETADILFPGLKKNIIQELSECNFGEFENKNYKEMEGNPHYQQWVDSGGTLPFPGGESREGFAERSIQGFCDGVKRCMEEQCTDAAFVVHGGTIMCIMEAFAFPKQPFYEWHVGNGCGYEIELDEKSWFESEQKFISVKALL